MTSDLESDARPTRRTGLRDLLKGSLLAFLIGVPLQAAKATSQLTGTTGYLSEWQFNVAWTDTAAGDRFSSPVTWKHIGLCSVNGTQEKVGDIDIQIRHLGPWSRVKVNVSFEQLRCTYSGSYAGTVTGFMECSDKTSLPLTLLFK